MALRPTNPTNRPEDGSEKATAQQDVFLKEVDDALREDEMLGAFRRYGRPAAFALGAGLLALGSYLWWDNSKVQAAGERGEKMTLALDSIGSNNLAGADQQLLAVKTGSGGSDAAVRLARAGVALGKGDTAGATKLYAEISADSSAPQPFRDLATVREVAANFDTMPPQKVIDRLKPLAIPKNPWFGSAGELVGLAYLKQGHEDMAGPLFAAIARDKTVPSSLRDRARSMAGFLGIDAIDDADLAALGSGPAPAPAAAAPQGQK